MEIKSVSVGLGAILAIVALVLTVVLVAIGQMAFLPLGLLLLLIELALLL